MNEAQGGVARDVARSVQDLRDAIGRHVDLSRQFSRAHIGCLEFFSPVFARMMAARLQSLILFISRRLARVLLLRALVIVILPPDRWS
jgi:hypothetical protein